jgi:predicted AAA+ superfamily ATPase
MIKRILTSTIAERIGRGKAIILIGARQVGKSTLFNELMHGLDKPVLTLNCDDPAVRDVLTEISSSDLSRLVGNNKVIMIDEGQRVSDIGMTVKRIVDNYPDVQVLVTGSSSLDLRSRLNEPMTGRKYEFTMYPVSTAELYDTYGFMQTAQLLEFRLVYGSYPEVLMHQSEARELIMGLSDSYLYKDILELDSVRKSELLRKLLVALALHVGSEVSYNEVAKTIGSDSRTVERYIDLLEKCFVVYRLYGLNRNMRNELKKSKKILFYDNGIRNAILNNFAPAELRADMGALWENFFIMERIKMNAYSGRYANYYFWRTTDQKEIDFIEESDGAFTIFEMKWNPRKGNVRFPQAFLDNYNCAASHVVTPENYIDLLATEISK